MKLLELKYVSAGYGDILVLSDISMKINNGEAVALVGSNGAGKTTILRVISGLTPVTSGEVLWDGMNLLSFSAYKRSELGIAHIPQGRGILGSLTVKDNLIMGSFCKRAKAEREKNLTYIFNLFPILKERMNQSAGSLSGGQQQMLAIGRALMSMPKLLILDEPSLGLAPIVVEEVFGILKKLKGEGVSILLIEQNIVQALSVADRGYVIEDGKIVVEGLSEHLLNNIDVKKAYLGI